MVFSRLGQELDDLPMSQPCPWTPGCHGGQQMRVETLRELNILDTPPDEKLDRVTRLAARIFRAPIAAISFSDERRQWVKSSVGFQEIEFRQSDVPCYEVVRKGHPLVVQNLEADANFSEKWLATKGLRFYAGVPLTTHDGVVVGALCVLDIVERRASDEEMAALHDLAAMAMEHIERKESSDSREVVSGLPNRMQLLDDLATVRLKKDDGEKVAIVIDLADPAEMNKLLGVLGTVYLDDVIRAGKLAIRDVVGRECRLYMVKTMSFLALMDANGRDSWLPVVKRLQTRLKAPILCGGIPVTVKAAIGVSPFSVASTVPRDVIRTAMSAACKARESELEYAVYDSGSDGLNRRRFALLSDVPSGLEQAGQFTLAFQPRVQVRSGVCASAEALLRWNHPLFGAVSPAEFIPLVEETALARPITRWVIAQALGQLAAWRDEGLDIRLSINISARNLEEEDFVENLRSNLKESGVPPSLFELEFTESALIRNRARVLAQLEQIRTMGIELAIDDFGSGYSTFSYLHKLPATVVKLDRSFMNSLEESKDQTLVRSMVNISHEMGYRVVAEGVETSEQYRFLEECGCDEVQGYLFSRPLSAAQFAHWLRERPDRDPRTTLGMLQGAMN